MNGRKHLHGRTFPARGYRYGVYYNWDRWKARGPVRCRTMKRAMERYYVLALPGEEV